jgi:thiamine biosynthesis protein ThiI
MDKEEIVHQAQAIGTYEISIQPDQDCCTLFTPKHPATSSTVRELEDAEAKLNVQALIQMATDKVEEVRFAFPPTTSEAVS